MQAFAPGVSSSAVQSGPALLESAPRGPVPAEVPELRMVAKKTELPTAEAVHIEIGPAPTRTRTV